ncbi:hypothetical protein DYH09_22615 [bacterium CPR1]|nr:hypothetical protein [bacterium CPR1]
MNVTAATAPSLAPYTRASQSLTPQSESQAAPQDQAQLSEGSEFGNAVKMGVGGVGALALIIPCMYAGVIGGAVVGSMLGLGFGPIAGAVTSNGFLGMVGTVWQSTSTVAKAGMVLGGVSGLLGGWATGTGVGNAVGRLFGADKEDPSKHVKISGPIKGTIGFVTVGGGAVAGGVGGGILGASVASAGSLIHGLTLNGFNMAAMSNMGSAALIGGGIGLVAFGAMGMMGGYKVAKTAARLVDKLTPQEKPPVQQPTPPPGASTKAA